MKTPHNIRKIAALLAATLIPMAVSTLAVAQNAQGSNTATNTVVDSNQMEHRHHHMKGVWEDLTKSERQQLRAAMEKIHQDPQLAAARKAVKDSYASLVQVRHDLLLKADPTLEPVLTKIKKAKED